MRKSAFPPNRRARSLRDKKNLERVAHYYPTLQATVSPSSPRGACLNGLGVAVVVAVVRDGKVPKEIRGGAKRGRARAREWEGME